MAGIVKKILSGLMVLIWILICGEISLRVISDITPIYNIEMLEYAKSLKIKSSNPEISHTHRKNSSAHLMGVDVNLNSLGHRSNELQNPKGKDEIRIFTIGDSIALGWGVAQEHSFSEGLAKKLNEAKGKQTGRKYVAINAGIGNYNTFYKVELFKEQVEIVNPDLVILQYFINDAQKNPSGTNNLFLKHSLLAAASHFYFSSIFSKMKKPLAEYYKEMYEDENPNWINAKASLEELKSICKEKKIQLIALLTPDMHDLSNDNPMISIYKKIEQTFDELQVPLVNTFPTFQAKYESNPKNAWVANDDAHPNNKVHQIIADSLYEFIENKNIIRIAMTN
jgi:lysophospholipase L1-like esterase